MIVLPFLWTIVAMVIIMISLGDLTKWKSSGCVYMNCALDTVFNCSPAINKLFKQALMSGVCFTYML